MGTGVFRNYYKGHWTKPRGRVEAWEGGGFGWGWGEGWGENADNCNSTTIKQCLKNIKNKKEGILV